MCSFYQNIELIDKLLETNKPNNQDFIELSSLLVNDAEVAYYFFDHNKSSEWFSVLYEREEFKTLGLEEKKITDVEFAKARYLKAVAKDVPEEVLNVILSVKPQHNFIKNLFLATILDLPTEKAIKAFGLIIQSLNGRQSVEWHFTGMRTAEYMIKIAPDFPNEAFQIAGLLLEIWKPEEKEGKPLFNDIESRFRAHEYKEIVNKYLKDMWKADPPKYFTLLCNTFDSYLKERGEEDYNVQTGFYHSIYQIAEIGQRQDMNIKESIVLGIREAGKIAIQSPDMADTVLELLEKKQKKIFERIKLYLLSFLPEGQQTDRIRGILNNKDHFFDEYYWYEYRLLLKQKSAEVDFPLDQLKVWLDERHISQEDRARIKEYIEDKHKIEPDYFDKVENCNRARELYLLRDIDGFRELYVDYKEKSKYDDQDIAPFTPSSGLRWFDPAEEAEISAKELSGFSADQVLTILEEKKDWKKKQERLLSDLTPERVQSRALTEDVKKRPHEYLHAGPDRLADLNVRFLEGVLDAFYECLHGNKADGDLWNKTLSIITRLSSEHTNDPEYKGVFEYCLRIIKIAVDDEELRNELILNNIQDYWNLIIRFITFPAVRHEDKAAFEKAYGSHTDPINASIRCVPAMAFELLIRLGVISKNADKKAYEAGFWPKLKALFEHIVNELQLPEVNCLYGLWFPQVCYLNENWVKDNVDGIFPIDNQFLWDSVWGTYVSWGSTSKQAFLLLKEAGTYCHAIDKIGERNCFNYSKAPDQGLTEHLMIAYFNSWVEYEDDLLVKYFNKSPVKLRGRAASFLMTGFKSVKEQDENYDVTAKRMKTYWENRLATIKINPEGQIEEACCFLEWVRDTLLTPEETFVLLEHTLRITDGEFGENRDAVKFVEGVCEISHGHELLALKCLNLAVNSAAIKVYFSIYKDKLRSFLEHVLELPANNTDIVEIKKQAVNFVDSLGRAGHLDFRDIWEQLNQ